MIILEGLLLCEVLHIVLHRTLGLEVFCHTAVSVSLGLFGCLLVAIFFTILR